MSVEKVLFRMPEEYLYHGIAYPRGPYPPEHLDEAREVKTGEGDVVLLSYPRTGTTLSIQLVSLLQCNNEEQLDAMDKTMVYNRVSFLEMKHLSGNEIENFEKKPSPRIVKSHFPAFLASNWLTNSRCVAVLRNPKDTLVSVFHFLQGIPEFGPFTGSWDDFFAVYQNGTLWNGDCLDWSVGMWKERHRPNVHVMFYENLIRNLEQETTELAKFLDLDRSTTQIKEVVERSQFASMKKNKATNYEDKSYLPGFQFVRSGKIGEWKKVFTVAQNEWMNARIAEKLTGTNLEFQYD